MQISVIGTAWSVDANIAYFPSPNMENGMEAPTAFWGAAWSNSKRRILVAVNSIPSGSWHLEAAAGGTEGAKIVAVLDMSDVRRRL